MDYEITPLLLLCILSSNSYYNYCFSFKRAQRLTNHMTSAMPLQQQQQLTNHELVLYYFPYNMLYIHYIYWRSMCCLSGIDTVDMSGVSLTSHCHVSMS
ncbi:hypothetical protein NP493_2836g00001 [Ridgeia piscesae]|uniref:Uncharacterized protein n=1 Tax=Ridgeia piscesae TaxID=27915 RepID=A0AAD9JCF6_RIDPI|nr:hypothetical protein NP493_2836g00001 [Ridgeia piscesae]